MNTTSITKNWAQATTHEVLNDIRQSSINIAVYDRDISNLEEGITHLLAEDVSLRASGSSDDILLALNQTIGCAATQPIIQDIGRLLTHFGRVTQSDEFRVLLTTVKTNMCRKFHTDINDLRLLCTYRGPGTLWLTENNINREALVNMRSTASIVLDEQQVRQAATGSAIILKGAIYPQEGASAVVHRSPPIESQGEKRLLLRIDTNTFLNFS